MADRTVLGSKPTKAVTGIIESGVTVHSRRIEFYQADGETPWYPGGTTQEMFKRIIDGNVTVDYGSAERRKIDLLLNDKDGALRVDPYEGLWYDKIVKVFRGFEYFPASAIQSALVVQHQTDDSFTALSSALKNAGISVVTKIADNTDSIDEYSFVVAESGVSGGVSTGLTNPGLLYKTWTSGGNVITFGIGHGTQIPFVSTANAGTTDWNGLVPSVNDNPASGKFTTYTPSPATGAPLGSTRVTALTSGAVRIAEWSSGAYVTAFVGYHPSGGVWFDYHISQYPTQGRNLIKAMVGYMTTRYQSVIWETQLGEFMIDGLDSDNFPGHVKLTGRDYTKKLLNSKITENQTFIAGTDLGEFITAVAVNGGIKPGKIKLDIQDYVFKSDMSFAVGTSRWEMINQACESFNYELFFDASGYLVARPYRDPTLSAISWAFGTGPTGNLVKYSKKVNDSRIFNRVVVIGNPADGEDRLPYRGVAVNADPASPTRIGRLGDRVMPPVETNWLSSDAECQEMAESILKVSALESYEISFESIYYPWLEVGEIVSIVTPDKTAIEPDRFLLDTISYPLSLSPMAATGKRITYVGDPGAGPAGGGGEE